MKIAKALVFVWTTVFLAWLLLIGVVKIVECLILPIPSTLLRSILGVIAYFLWVTVLIVATKLLYRKVASSRA